MAKPKKICAVCTPNCIRSCSIVARREKLSKTVTCPSCKGKIPMGERRCPTCGLVVETVCPKCLSVNTMEDGTCSSCGFQAHRVDQGPSQWYSYTPDDQVGVFAPPPGTS